MQVRNPIILHTRNHHLRIKLRHHKNRSPATRRQQKKITETEDVVEWCETDPAFVRVEGGVSVPEAGEGEGEGLVGEEHAF